MNKGVHLTLMIGPVVPVPVPGEVLAALTGVQVTTTAGQTSGFQLTFNLSHRSPLHTMFLISGGSSIPLVRVMIIVTVKGMPEVLMDGVMTNHEVTSGNDAGNSTLTITGEDLTRVMDYVDCSGIPYPAMAAQARVSLILGKYASFGIVPLVIPGMANEVSVPAERIPEHRGTDLNYLRLLAEETGYVFYVEPGPKPGVNMAYWGPEVKIGVPQPALNINMDAHTNVNALNFSFNSESKTLPVVFMQDKTTKASIPVPIPDFTPLNPPLGVVPPMPKKITQISGTAKLSPIQAAAIGMARASKSADCVWASGTLDVVRYGRVLKARQLVGVRGAGLAFDGLYYVKSVTHSIKQGEYKQSFQLSRSGLISTIPEVPA